MLEWLSWKRQWLGELVTALKMRCKFYPTKMPQYQFIDDYSDRDNIVLFLVQAHCLVYQKRSLASNFWSCSACLKKWRTTHSLRKHQAQNRCNDTHESHILIRAFSPCFLHYMTSCSFFFMWFLRTWWSIFSSFMHALSNVFLSTYNSPCIVHISTT